jgi:hypothetical protein
MAQADSVRSSSRQLITGESANQSTSLRAIKLPAVRVQPVDRHYFVGDSDARVIRDSDEGSSSGSGGKDAPKLSWKTCRTVAGMRPAPVRSPWARTSGLYPSRPSDFCWGGCSGTFLSCFGSGAGISAYASGHSTGCHQTGWSHRSHRGG